MSDGDYFARDAPAESEAERLTILERIYDPDTIAWVERTGVTSGWRCLVPGAGHGSIARWLADRVAPSGHVVATDINTDVPTPSGRDNLELRRHDLVSDDLEEAAFDLVVVRYLLTHLVGRQPLALDRLVAALRPGAWLVVEESDAEVLRPAAADHPAYDDVRQALEAGNAAVRSHIDIQAGRHVAALVARHPQLNLVAHEARATLWGGGSIHAQFLAQTNARTRAKTAPPAEIQARREIIDAAYADPTFVYLGELRHYLLARRND